MPTRTAKASWMGNLKQGKGNMQMQSGSYNGPFTFASRFENGAGTNPEELIAAAHAGCFSMALSADLERNNFVPQSVQTTATVHLDIKEGKPTVHTIELYCEAKVAEIDAATFQKIAQETKQNCPISRLVAGAEIKLNAKLV